jgi:hypothetical protein
MLLDAASHKGVETKEQNFTHLGRRSFSQECNDPVENRQMREGSGAVRVAKWWSTTDDLGTLDSFSGVAGIDNQFSFPDDARIVVIGVVGHDKNTVILS